MSFFSFAGRRNSAPVARERLQILLEYERRIISQFVERVAGAATIRRDPEGARALVAACAGLRWIRPHATASRSARPRIVWM